MFTLAYSPCPNDTFMFHALVSGAVSRPGWRFDVHLHDVEALNQAALEGRYDITKLSFHGWLVNRERYRLLRAGAALGFGCGPLIVSKRLLDREEIARARIAVPGRLTTAHLLLRLWQPAAGERLFSTYDRIRDLVLSGEADCGVIIHEGRFTYADHGLRLVVDLGSWWEDLTSLPLPLGCIAMRESISADRAEAFAELLAESVKRARADPEASLPYMERHALEMDRNVLWRHVRMFVNEFSLDLGEQGGAAVKVLEEMAVAAGVIS